MFIIGIEGPTVKIELEQEDFVVFKKIIFMHSGSKILNKFREAAPYEPKYAQEPSTKAIREFEIDKKMDCLLMISSGGVILRDCQLTLNSMPKRLKSKYPCIVTMPKTFINMTSCEVTGNMSNYNAGAIFINSHVFISDCTFTDFKSGGIWCLGKPH